MKDSAKKIPTCIVIEILKRNINKVQFHLLSFVFTKTGKKKREHMSLNNFIQQKLHF